ncbi:MAG: serine/threonine protein kinase [Holophagales bacterium]|nr:serine/threonine protein kinase [Holophagales bacterium]
MSSPSSRARSTLLLRFGLALAAMGLLPLGISLFQLSGQEKVLEEQAKTFHQVATRGAVRAVQGSLDIFSGLARSTAEHPRVLEGLRSGELGQVLTGTVASLPAVLAVGVFDLEGTAVMAAQRRDLEPEIGPLFGPEPGSATVDTEIAVAGQPPQQELRLFQGSGGPVLHIRQPLRTGAGYLVLAAAADSLAAALDEAAVTGAFEMCLVSRDQQLILGGEEVGLDHFPSQLLERMTENIGSHSSIYRGFDGGIVAGFAPIENADWFLLSRQNVAEAELAKARLRRVGAQTSLLAIAMTLLLSAGGYVSVIRPLRRLAKAQRELAGGGTEKGSEIAQIEASFDLLRQRIRDSEDLGQIFLGRYQVTGLVGSGAMGSVFRGWDDKLQRPVALKTVHLEAENVDRDKLLVNLRNEAAITARIHQPNIVTVYDIEDRGASAFIAMELVEGLNLQRLLQVRGYLRPTDAVLLGAAVARGLATAHDHFLVHHDVKPANILLGLDGSIKLTDFGVSVSITAASQAKDVICGTPGYLAPECFEGDDYTPSSDLWALGVVIWETATGKHPYRGSNLRNTVARTLAVDAQPLDRLVPSTPPALARLVDSLLQKEPRERPDDAHYVAEQLETLVRELDLVWVPDFSDALEKSSGPLGSLATEATQLISRPD